MTNKKVSTPTNKTPNISMPDVMKMIEEQKHSVRTPRPTASTPRSMKDIVMPSPYDFSHPNDPLVPKAVKDAANKPDASFWKNYHGGFEFGNSQVE